MKEEMKKLSKLIKEMNDIHYPNSSVVLSRRSRLNKAILEAFEKMDERINKAEERIKENQLNK